MSNVGNTSPGYLDALTGSLFRDTPHLDKFRSVAKTIAAVDAEERRELLDGQNAEYILIYGEVKASAERVAAVVQAYQSLGHKNTTAHKVAQVLNDCQLELETILGKLVA